MTGGERDFHSLHTISADEYDVLVRQDKADEAAHLLRASDRIPNTYLATRHFAGDLELSAS